MSLKKISYSKLWNKKKYIGIAIKKKNNNNKNFFYETVNI